MVVVVVVMVCRLVGSSKSTRAAHPHPVPPQTCFVRCCDRPRWGVWSRQATQAYRHRLLVRHAFYVGIFVVCWVWPAVHRGVPVFRHSKTIMFLDSVGITSQVRVLACLWACAHVAWEFSRWP
jgi:hypothetical protein